jgi:hypothetical protein
MKNRYAESRKNGGRLLNIDGKTIRGSASRGKEGALCPVGERKPA